jgi:hypothetical protein
MLLPSISEGFYVMACNSLFLFFLYESFLLPRFEELKRVFVGGKFGRGWISCVVRALAFRPARTAGQKLLAFSDSFLPIGR